MKTKVSVLWMALIAGMLLMSGCEKRQIQVELTPTPTPLPTATPTPLPTPTPTPVPTATVAPRLIGTKSSSSKAILLTNNFSDGLRKLYIRVSGSGEWNNNLIPSESVIRVAEQVKMYYEPGNGESGNGRYDIRIFTKLGEVYEIYGVDLDDMDAARLVINNNGLAKLNYVSLSTKEETSTDDAHSDWDDDWDDDWDYYEESYDHNDSYEYDYNENDYNYDTDYDTGYNEEYDNSGQDYVDNSYNEDYSDGNDEGYDEDYSEDYGGDEDYGYDYDYEGGYEDYDTDVIDY